jgi:hypothetical protein
MLVGSDYGHHRRATIQVFFKQGGWRLMQLETGNKNSSIFPRLPPDCPLRTSACNEQNSILGILELRAQGVSVIGRRLGYSRQAVTRALQSEDRGR